ncbi:MAG TPA: PKD domain-containing protein [Chitinophagaceae bacterium]|nr:PKD domain-containing protein [Chitinophagaceae bacterium]
MKLTHIILGSTLLLAGATGCKKDGIDSDLSFLSTAKTANNNSIFDITNDNSGKVTITPTSEGGVSYLVKFGHGTGNSASAEVTPGKSAVHNYPEGSYTVEIVTRSMSGDETSASYPLQVTYRAPENIKVDISKSGHTVKVKASALYAASYLVYFGDVTGETGTALAKGAEVSHTYASYGDYDIKVVALSGGAAKSEQTTSIHVYDPLGLPITFDAPDQFEYFFGTFGGGQQFATVDNPDPSGLNTSAKVGKFTRGYEFWSGTYTPLNTPIDMSQGKIIKVWAYNPDPTLIGKKLNVELESGSSIANGIAVVKTAFTTSGAWEELVFDYSGISGIPANEKFSQLVLRFNDAADGSVPGGQGAVIYVDNFRLTN